MAGENAVAVVDNPTSSSLAENTQKWGEGAAKAKRKGRRVVARLWRVIFGRGGDDCEKRLKHLSKEEASLHSRMRRRALSSRRMVKNVIIISLVLEVAAVIYAIMTTRSLDLNWRMRVIRMLSTFALPALSFLAYSALTNLTRLFDRKDQKTLEKLRAERQAKIDELKERTNYYTTQQLIQRYDLDPTAKAAAATVLATKLGADSGLKVFLGDESIAARDITTGKSYDVEMVQSKSLRNLRPSHTRSHSTGTLIQFVSNPNEHDEDEQSHKFVEHYKGLNPSITSLWVRTQPNAMLSFVAVVICTMMHWNPKREPVLSGKRFYLCDAALNPCRPSSIIDCLNRFEMWRWKSPIRVIRSSILRKFSPSPEALRVFRSLPPAPSEWASRISTGFLNREFCSASNELSLADDKTSRGLEKNSSLPLHEADDSPVELGGLGSSGDSVSFNGTENEKGVGVGDFSFGVENNDEEAASEVPELDIDQVESVISILQSTLPQDIGASLDRLQDLQLSVEFVVRVFQEAHVSGKNLVSFFRWAMRKEETVKCSVALDQLVRTISATDELNKMEAYLLWDLIKEIGKEEGIVKTEMLNQLISIFGKLRKPKAGLEVFNKFGELCCAPDGNTYYFTMEALETKFMVDAFWLVCERMLNSGSLPDREKIAKIILFLCKRKKAKEAHLVYLLAKENNIFPGHDALDVLIAGLCANDDSVHSVLELLDDYPKESLRYANRTFSFVLKGLKRVKDVQAAKKLLLRMVDSGPSPGNSAFNIVITALCKEAEVEDAIALTKLMESRGLTPGVYTYSVIMSGYAKAGLMDEAFKIFCDAKKHHKTFTPVTYHILIRGYCKIEEYEKALECLREMKEYGVNPGADEYNKLIKTLCLKALDWHSAEKLLEQAKENGLCLDEGNGSLIAAVKSLEEEEKLEMAKIDA
ncbi:hypothetical protein HPP92_012451 [Vanilla planifolia]|uniref:Pentatricopeptide repeat-containing protein n=1 Tax=Vanilla planifolia TaxID=51239 RepID=A0A835R1K6_VANPL|nr:hypothetical protein HPP92_012451 [Vanilla planifolia]